MKPSSLIAVIFNLALAVALSSCTAEDNSPGGGGGGGVDTTLAGETYIDNFTAKLTTSKTAINTSWVTKPAPDGWTVTRYTIILTDADDKRTTTTVPVGTGANYSRDITAKIGTYRVAIVAYVSDAAGTVTATSPVVAGEVEIPDQTEAPASPPALTVTASNYDGQGHLIVTWEAPTNAGKYSNGTVATITNYTLYWKKGGAPSSTDYDGIATVSTNQDRSHTIEGLDAGTYHVSVVSKNSLNLESDPVKVAVLLLSAQSASNGDDTLTISADGDLIRAAADDAVLLAGITVNRLPAGGVRGTANLATAATLIGNSLVITISTSTVQGDEWFVEMEAGLVEDGDGNANAAIELSTKIAFTDRFLVADLPRSTATFPGTSFVLDNYRTFFVTFSIGTGTATEGEYRLGLKASSKPELPTVNELTNANAALTRTLSAEKINIYLPFHIEGTYFDTGATQDYTNARATLLSPATKYSLYLTPADGSGSVEKVLDFTTDAVPATIPGTAFYGVPSAKYRYTVRTNEPIMFVSEFETVPDVFVIKPNVSSAALITQCDSTSCGINLSDYPSYKGWGSNPAKTYILTGLKYHMDKVTSLEYQWDSFRFSFRFNNATKSLLVYLTFQAAP